MTGLAYARLRGRRIRLRRQRPRLRCANALDSVDVSTYADQFEYDDWNRASGRHRGAGASSLINSSATGDFSYRYDNDGRSRRRGLESTPGARKRRSPCRASSARRKRSIRTMPANRCSSSLTDPDDAVNPALDGPDLEHLFAYDPQGRLRLDGRALDADAARRLEPRSPRQADRRHLPAHEQRPRPDRRDRLLYVPATTAGYVEDTYVQDGQQASTEALQDYINMRRSAAAASPIYPVSDETGLSAATSDVERPSGRDTHFDYESDGLHITQVTETLPQVIAGNRMAWAEPARSSRITIPTAAWPT